MQKEYLPKPLKGFRKKVYKGFTKLDILIIFIFLVLTILVWTALPPIKAYLKLAIAASILLFGLVLTVTGKNNTKLYEKLFFSLIFITSKKAYTRKDSSMLFPYDKLEDGLVKLKTGSYVKVIELRGFAFFLLPEQEQQQRINAFQQFLLRNTNKFKLYKVNLPIDLQDQQNYVQSLQKKWTKNKQIFPIANLSEAILNNLVDRNTHVQDRYFLFVYGGSRGEIDSNYKYLSQPLVNAFLRPEEITSSKKLCKILSSLYGNEVQEEETKTGNKVLSLRCNVKFHSRYIKTESGYMKMFNVFGLPQEAYVGWISTLGQVDGVDWMIDIKEYPKDKARAKLDKVIYSLEERSNKKASEEAETNAYLDAMYQLNQKLNGEGETIKSLSIFVIAKAKTKKELEKIIKDVKGQASGRSIQLSTMLYLQKDMFKEFIPSLSKEVKFTPSVEMHSMGLAYGFPFINEDHKDKNGFYIGYSESGRNVFFDPLIRNDLRVNSNMYIFGASGKGKSTTSKKIMKELFLGGNKVIAIDPEREYDILCKNLGGTWLNFGTDRSAKEENYIINPMQFLKNESDDREMLSSHVQFLEQFFKTLLPEVTQKELTILKRYIIEAYANKKITDANSYLKLSPDRFPVISDIYNLVKRGIKKEKDQIQKDILINLSIYLEPFGDKRSPESKLWNNQTNFNLYESDFIVADIQSLGDNDRLKNAQMFILLKMVNNFMVENKIKMKSQEFKKSMALVIDEAHLLVDENAPFATRFMFEVVKRGRKYNAMTIITTQSVKDFLGGSGEILKLTSGIINNCQYAFILGLRSGDIADLDDSMRASGGLTNEERESLATATLGKALFIASEKDRKIIQIDVADEELAIWEKLIEQKGVKNVRTN